MDVTMKMEKIISRLTSQEEFYKRAKELGITASRIFYNKNQLRNLLTIASTTLKITDILNYIKNQAAKTSGGDNWNKSGFAHELINLLYEDENQLIGKYKKEFVRQMTTVQTTEKVDAVNLQQVHLQLCREFIKQMVVQYNFLKSSD